MKFVNDEEILGTSLPSSSALSYLGDARHSLFVRRMLVERGYTKSGDLNRAALNYVTAQAQAAAYRKIEDRLTADERAVFKRAANSTHLNRPKHASVTDYRYATGLEAVIGMLEWLRKDERINELLELAYGGENDTED